MYIIANSFINDSLCLEASNYKDSKIKIPSNASGIFSLLYISFKHNQIIIALKLLLILKSFVSDHFAIQICIIINETSRSSGN